MTYERSQQGAQQSSCILLCLYPRVLTFLKMFKFIKKKKKTLDTYIITNNSLPQNSLASRGGKEQGKNITITGLKHNNKENRYVNINTKQ